MIAPEPKNDLSSPSHLAEAWYLDDERPILKVADELGLVPALRINRTYFFDRDGVEAIRDELERRGIFSWDRISAKQEAAQQAMLARLKERELPPESEPTPE